MKPKETKLRKLIAEHRHLPAIEIQHIVWTQWLVLLPVGKIAEQLEIARAEAHASGAVTPR